jgi:uncharacterized protein YqgC (DUF456 family)
MLGVITIIRFVLIVICIGIGFVGLIMPLLPGWLFFAVAALLLFPDTKLARKTVDWLSTRAPRVARVLRKLQKRDG